VLRARAAATDAASAGLQIRFIQAVFVPVDETCFALYQAGSVADVTAAGSRAGLEFDRIAAARVVL
jgi:hypothetical protein